MWYDIYISLLPVESPFPIGMKILRFSQLDHEVCHFSIWIFSTIFKRVFHLNHGKELYILFSHLTQLGPGRGGTMCPPIAYLRITRLIHIRTCWKKIDFSQLWVCISTAEGAGDITKGSFLETSINMMLLFSNSVSSSSLFCNFYNQQ